MTQVFGSTMTLGGPRLPAEGTFNPYVVGFDFGAPKKADDQRRKIVGLWAKWIGERRFSLEGSGPNLRVVEDRGPSVSRPGWTVAELLQELATAPVAAVAFDFPFSIPASLLTDASFAALIGLPKSIATLSPTLPAWDSYLAAVGQQLQLSDPLDFTAFTQWRNTQFWHKRHTDVLANAQPPLKHIGQNLFQMTLVGAAVLARLKMASYSISPFDGPNRTIPTAIEIYPGHALRRLGVNPPKGRPNNAIHAVLHRLALEQIHLEVDGALLDRVATYATGSGDARDYELADAFVALGTAMLHAYGATAKVQTTTGTESIEGVIWSPTVLTANS